MKIKNFKCNDLSQYVDSMLFDSGECIAEMTCECDDIQVYMHLEVRGDVKVEYDGNIYRHPSEFPPALRESIKTNPGWWDTADNVYIDMNNWFEYIYTAQYTFGDFNTYSDGVMCEWDINKGTPEDIKNEMIEIFKCIINEVEYIKSLMDEEY